MDNKKTSTVAAAASVEPTSRIRDQSPNVRMVQNFYLIWLDESINEINDKDYGNSITNLRQVVNTVDTFTDADGCIDHIIDNMAETTFMIVSETLSGIIIPIAQDIPQVISIYIICSNNTQHEQWTKQWSKVKGVFTDITPICEALKQAAHDCDQNSVSISFVKTTDGASNKNHNELDSSFMYTQILKEILLTIDFEPVHFNEFLTYCRKQLAGNTTELKNVDKLEKEYRHHQPIWWYTYNCFLYSMLNRALRTMEVELIIKMGFFVRDLHENLAALHTKQYGEHGPSTTFTVYRGQGLFQTDFDQLKKTQDGLLSFNNFLSTSFNREVSFSFAESNHYNPDMIGILFQITIDLSISYTPFAKVNDGYYHSEEELLLSMHSVFRIGPMKQIDGNNRLWQVDLLLTSNNDPDFRALTEQMRAETFPHLTGWRRLCALLINLGQFNKAQELGEVLLDQASDECEESVAYHILGRVKDHHSEYADAITLFEKSTKILQKIFSPNHPDLAISYDNIGSVYTSMGGYSKALSYFQKALEIRQKTLSSSHPNLAISYNNIGWMYDNMGDYSKALSYYEKALEISKKSLPTSHPLFAASYNNIGAAYQNMGDYSKALSYYEKALEIFQKSLPSNHPDLAASYNNIGLAYFNMADYSKALSYYEKALNIHQKSLSSSHLRLATYYNNIGSVYDSMGGYSKALSYYEKALDIHQKSLPPSHPLLATYYNNIGWVYSKIGDHSKALSSHEKALEIFQKSLPPNHPSWASSYNNISLVCFKMDDYSKALSNYEKALEIFQKTLPSNHPNLASSYNNIGTVHSKMGDCSKALSSYEKALKIYQKSLPPSPPNMAISYNNIGSVYDSMGDYSKALSFYERAVDIGQRSLPPNHPYLQVFKKKIESVKKKL